MAGVPEALREPFLPFFIGANRSGPRPGDSGDAGGLTWIEVAGDEQRLNEWLGGAELPIRVVEGAPAVRAIGIGEPRVPHELADDRLHRHRGLAVQRPRHDLGA